MQVVIVTGLSGAGKTQVVICLEDLGYYCIDNMPPALIKPFLELVMHGKSDVEKAAFVIDVRGGEFFTDTKQYLDDLKTTGLEYKVVFLEASDEVLIRRYNETRRAHPLSSGEISNMEGIKKERTQLDEIRKISDYVIDTSNMKATKLRQEIIDIFTTGQQEENFTINIKSFGYKHGIPLDADIVFDMRFIPNPFYVPSLKRLTGNSRKVRDYVMKFQESKDFVQQVHSMLKWLIPCYMREGKFSLNIAFGCTGGQHRSVTLANEFAEIFEEEGRRITIEHRDL